jgi:hypothetical protein
MKKANLTTSIPVPRTSKRRAFPISELPPARDLISIINWLDVETNPRYLRTPRETFCNIYAYDVATAYGAYLPRVWWTLEALKRLESGDDVGVQYGRTVVELNANALADWFSKHSKAFGWVEVFSKTEAQRLANLGSLVVCVAANKNRSRSGHITVVAPEHDGYSSISANGVVVSLLQSQAGGVNFRYRATDWQRGHEPIRMYAFKRR